MIKGEKLGEGSFGLVYGGLSPKTGKEIAVKRNLAEQKTSFIGVAREVDILYKLLNHPHIVSLDKIAFGYPFVDGIFSPICSVDRKTQRDDSIHFVFKKAAYDLHMFIKGAVVTDFSLIKRYMVNILLGTEYMHGKGIIHRDLKPSNILIFGDEPDALGVFNVAKICDFGLAKPYTYQGTNTPSVVTSWYRAPEITLSYPFYDYKVDIWSIGCIFFEMMTKTAFLEGSSDDDDHLLSQILGKLPTPLSLKRVRELTRNNKWKKVSLTAASRPRSRKSFQQMIGLSKQGLKNFEEKAGSFDAFIDLLTNMLNFEWDKRFTATQCLDHPFFEDYKCLIYETRKKHSPISAYEHPMYVHECVERHWMAIIATGIFNNRSEYKQWYSDRVLFQAMDLYDRYLHAMLRETTIMPHMVESELKGYIHDKFNAELRFWVCFYLSVKYFSSLHVPIPFENIVPDQFKTEEALLIAEHFEGGLVMNCLQYDIYRPTVYEAADLFDEKLEEHDIRNLIALYSLNNSFSGMTPIQLFDYYRTNLRNAQDDDLYLPIQPL